MACRHAFLPEEDLSCPVCCDIFRHPVLLPCSHSICQICLWQFWKQKGSRECPICRRVSATDQTPCNLALKNLCESFLQNRSQTASFSRLPEVHCIPHKEQFKLFCLDDEQPVCLVCQASRKHSEHTFLPIDEAAQDYKGQLQTSLKLLQEKLRVHNQFKLTYHQTSSHIKIQAQDTERQIRREFEELQQFLRDEQAARLTALKAEERQKSRVMREKIEKINKDIGTLSDTVRPTEKEMRTEHALFLQNFKATMERAQYTLPDIPQQPDCVSGCLINVAEHLGNLKFRVWEKMKNKVQYTSVILDPNSAHPRLILSRDLTSINFGDAKQLPDNAERFDYWECVVGSGGLDSGCHCWDVEVGDSKGWDVGVTPESNQRKGISFSWERVWRVGFRETGMHYSGPHLHKLQQRLQRVRVHLNMATGQLAFWDPISDTHLHTFTHTFTESLFPFFYSNLSNAPQRILPGKISVFLE
ncbi:E3 ubiquitin-protein ligase TRIM35-like [Clupea harengus]|uniref:E3 ubiquitin-protein ligase TRIM35-like n=1 Tax=Clupea harengus TaxID=7950 RepID=A0A6P8FV86_CLUHA|nr:E3 ubiquitin-protein ligase TRIM35-like [Clupea harengus]